MFFVVSILLWPIWLATCMSVAPEAISRLAQTWRSSWAVYLPVDNRPVDGDPLAVEVDVFHRHRYGLFQAEPGERPEHCDVA
jgi:hypothetical protein